MKGDDHLGLSVSILNPMTTILIRKGKERFETPKRKKTQTEKGKGSVITEAKKKKDGLDVATSQGKLTATSN